MCIEVYPRLVSASLNVSLKNIVSYFEKEGKTKQFKDEEKEELCRVGGAMQGPELCLHSDEALFGFSLHCQDAKVCKHLILSPEN